MKATFILTIAAFLVSYSCSKHEATLMDPDARQVNLNDTVILSVGNSAEVNNKNLLLTFLEVSDDSRCPINYNCIWAGNAILKFQAELSGKTTLFELHTSYGNQDQKIIGDYIIKLISLKPEPLGGTITRQEEYKAGIKLLPMPKGFKKGMVKDYTGLDGCGLVIELDGGIKLEPRDGLNILLKNKRVALKFTEVKDAMSICMVGTVADIQEIYELVE